MVRYGAALQAARSLNTGQVCHAVCRRTAPTWLPDALIYDQERFCLRTGEGKDVVNLHNFYAEHCKLPRSVRRQHLQQSALACLTSQQELPEEFEHAKPDLRIKLWCRAM